VSQKNTIVSSNSELQ